MNRREFFVNSLAASGAVATIGLLDAEKLLAIPPEPIIVPPTAWSWDGTADAYLVRLTDLFSDRMERAHRFLIPVPQVTKWGERHGALTASRFLHAGWELPSDFRLGMAGFYEECPPNGEMVVDGYQLVTNKYDPLASIERLAEQFADKVLESHGCGYGRLEMPLGLHTAVQHGPFRLLSQYDIRSNMLPLRIDMLMLARATAS